MITEPQTNGFLMADIPRNQGFRVCVMQIQGRELDQSVGPEAKVRMLGLSKCKNYNPYVIGL